MPVAGADDVFETTSRGDVAIITMAHGKANALDSEFCDALAVAFNELRTAKARAVVLTGQGTIFSAGVDLLRTRDAGPDYVRDFLPRLHRLYETIFFFPKPVVAAINGHAVAGGCVLACACDRRIMTREPGRIGVTELLVGLPFPTLAFEIMRFVTASHCFEDMIFSGTTFSPQDGAERGLVNEIAGADDLMDRAVAAANTLAAIAPNAFALTKRQSREPVMDRYGRDGARFDAEVTEIWTSEQATRTIRDYVSRTLKKK
jgi:enoyl-CoA hydratase